MDSGLASMTARGVAAYRQKCAREPAEFGRPEDDDLLQAQVAAGLEPPPLRLAPYLQARTLFIDRAVVAAITDGIDQIVSVGAGYDGRCFRYAAPGVRWIELDHPATQADKRKRLAQLGLDAAGIGFAAADFVVDDVGSALSGAGHDPAAPTLFICEGVAGYLDVATLRSVLSALRDRAATGSRMAVEISLVTERDDDHEQRAQLRAQLSRAGEPLIGEVRADELESVLDDLGWAVDQAVDARGVPLAEGARNTAFVSATPAATPVGDQLA